MGNIDLGFNNCGIRPSQSICEELCQAASDCSKEYVGIKECTKEEKARHKAQFKTTTKAIDEQTKTDLELAKTIRNSEKESSNRELAIAKDHLKNSTVLEKLKIAKANVNSISKTTMEIFKEYKKSLVSLFTLSNEKLSQADKKSIKSIQGKIMKMSQVVHETVMEVAEKLDIVSILNKYPTKLSGGQQQRVAIARGIVKKPDILLMDEPLSNLDAKLRIEARNWIRSIQQDLGITLVFVTHDQEEAMSISDTIICLNNGLVQQMGAPMELYEKPKNIFVAKFLGMPEMKIFKGTIDSKGYAVVGGEKLSKVSIKHSGQKVQVGVRADAFTISKTKGFASTIVSVELLGKETLIHANIKNNGPVNILLSGIHKYNVGDKIKIVLPKKLHIFDKDGERI